MSCPCQSGASVRTAEGLATTGRFLLYRCSCLRLLGKVVIQGVFVLLMVSLFVLRFIAESKTSHGMMHDTMRGHVPAHLFPVPRERSSQSLHHGNDGMRKKKVGACSRWSQPPCAATRSSFANTQASYVSMIFINSSGKD